MTDDFDLGDTGNCLSCSKEREYVRGQSCLDCRIHYKSASPFDVAAWPLVLAARKAENDAAATRSALRQLADELRKFAEAHHIDRGHRGDTLDGCSVGRCFDANRALRLLVCNAPTREGDDEMNDEEDEIRCDT